MYAKFKARLVSYWKSDQASIHGIIALLSGGSGLATLEALNLHEGSAKFICALAVVVGALLVKPQ